MQITRENLANKYFYKTELAKLCHERNLPTYGTKAELAHYLTLYLNDVSPSKIIPIRKNQPRSSSTQKLTLDTKLIGDGFKFNKTARTFFENYYHVNKFSFTKTMATIKRRVEAENNTTYSIRDLISELEKASRIIETPEERTYEWNQFVKDFNKDPASKQFHSRMKVAAILWKVVRDSRLPKMYSHELMAQCFDQIKSFSNYN